MSNETSSLERSLSALKTIYVLPLDLIALFVLATASAIVYTWPSVVGPVPTTLIGLPLLLFAPGYTLLAILYPASSERNVVVADWQVHGSGDHWLDWPARLALSLGTSVALVPIVALLSSIAGVDLATVPTVVAGLVATGSVIGALRYGQLPPERRHRIPIARFTDSIAPSVSSVHRTKSAITLLLAISILVAMSTVGYALVVPNDGESYSSLYLGTENETGELVAGSFPTEFTANEGRDLAVGVENNEGETVSYTIVVELHRVDTRDGTNVVFQREELQRFSTTLDDGETWERSHEVTPGLVGDNMRLTYSLYRGDAPSNSSDEEPYRQVYIWIDVKPPGEE